MSAHRDSDRPGDVRGSDLTSGDSPDVIIGGDDRVDDLSDGSLGDVARIALVASVEPSVVFSSLASYSVPALCDDCTIDIIDGDRARYRIAYPPRGSSGGLLRLADRASSAPGHQVRVPFAHPRADERSEPGVPPADRDHFHGVATFVWHRRVPSSDERTVAILLVDHAVRTVAWQRSERAAALATTKQAHLQVALQTSRQVGMAIGILMSQHKVTQDRAFELLRVASQHSNRKVRDLAVDVVDTGWLDPALLSPPPKDGSRGREQDSEAGPGGMRHD